MSYDDHAPSRRRLLRQMNEREDNLFHLQQELLRQGGQQFGQGFGEMPTEQTTMGGLQPEDSMRMQRRRLEALRDSLKGDASSQMQMSQGGATMDMAGSVGMGGIGGSFAFHPTTTHESEASPQLSLKRAAMAAPPRHDGLSKSVGASPGGRYFDAASFGGQPAMAPVGTNRGSFQMPDTQSYPDMNDYAGIDGSSQGAVARKSYHDEPNFQSLSNQYDYGPMPSPPPPMNNSTTAPQNVGWEASNRLLARAWTSFRDEQSDRINTNQSGQQLGPGSHHSLPSSMNDQPSRAFEISSQAGPTQRQAAQGMPRSSSPYTSWLHESSSRTVDAPQGSLGPPNNHQPHLVDAASGSIKRRRLESGESLLLEMLTDTIVSPPAAKAMYGQPQSAHQAMTNAPHGDSAIMRAALAGSGGLATSLSPYASYAKPSSASMPPNDTTMALTPNQHVAGTPKMFADYMFGGGGGVDVSGMPPPPFGADTPNETHTKSMERPDLGFQGAAAPQGCATGDVIVLTEDPPVSSRSTALGPLPLPPRKGGHGKKRSKGSKGPKKGKDGTGTAADTSNHIITPSTSTIAALTQEIRSRVRSSSKDERTADDADPQSHNAITDFASAIEASQSSQQAIHDWDRKFGLRRAHSKTMRESCRSRKKVLDLLKGESGGALFLLVKTTEADDSRASAAAVAQDKTTDGAEEPSGERVGRVHEETKASSQRSDPAHTSDEDVAKTSPSKVDDQLTQLFRRASLECAKPVLPADILAVARPPPLDDADRRQFHANSA